MLEGPTSLVQIVSTLCFLESNCPIHMTIPIGAMQSEKNKKSEKDS